jgi:DNA primase
MFLPTNLLTVSGKTSARSEKRQKPRRLRRWPPNLPGAALPRLVERIARTITSPSVWGARPDAGSADVLLTWKQLVALHRQWHSLTRELRDAETALGQDNTEANYARLRDVKARLSSLEGTEALVEGFGASSGRAAKSI